MKKLIFLDIDGVLNDELTGLYQSTDGYWPEIKPDCVKAFNRIIRATEAKIVLSSSWRYHILNGNMSLHGFFVLLRSHGVRGELVGHTRESSDSLEPRWIQIKDWLKDNRSDEFRRCCILDDDPSAFGGIVSGVQTGNGGLTDANAAEAIALLNA